jgi:hypothetical protein
MKARAVSLALGVGLLAPAGPAAAEDPQPLGPGVRVRIAVATSRDRLKGTVQALDESVLSVISDDHELIRVPRSSITGLETGWGRRGNAKRGLVIGGLVGVGVGLLVCGVDETYRHDSDRISEDTACHGGEWVAFPLLTGVAYGGLGALIGHFIKTDRWVEVPLDRVKVSLGPAPAGVGLSLSVRF